MVLQLPKSVEILPKVASEKKQEAPSENTSFSLLSNVSFARYGGLCLSFCGIATYLHGLVSMYERLIIEY